MVSAEMVRDIESLKPDELTLVLSMIKSFINQKDRTEAQKQFEIEREKYKDRRMTMEEIDKIIHEGDEE
ncbi:MAG: hypothetical protein IJ873_03435 [Lachnospiraceae bacterium]|nr:hypothetical protein [Lachnospiraceae bacterium]